MSGLTLDTTMEELNQGVTYDVYTSGLEIQAELSSNYFHYFFPIGIFGIESRKNCTLKDKKAILGTEKEICRTERHTHIYRAKGAPLRIKKGTHCLK